MRKIILISIAFLCTIPAVAAIVTEAPPVVPVADIVRVQTIPAYHSQYYYKGKLSFVDRAAQKVCYDKNNRKVACVENMPAPAVTPAAASAAPANMPNAAPHAPPPPAPLSQRQPPQPSQYDSQYDNQGGNQYEH